MSRHIDIHADLLQHVGGERRLGQIEAIVVAAGTTIFSPRPWLSFGRQSDLLGWLFCRCRGAFLLFLTVPWCTMAGMNDFPPNRLLAP
jgi:hypothetical protein